MSHSETVEAALPGLAVGDAAKHFIKWYEYGHWTPHGKVFDIGFTTRAAIRRLMQGKSPVLAGRLAAATAVAR